MRDKPARYYKQDVPMVTNVRQIIDGRSLLPGDPFYTTERMQEHYHAFDTARDPTADELATVAYFAASKPVEPMTTGNTPGLVPHPVTTPPNEPAKVDPPETQQGGDGDENSQKPGEGEDNAQRASTSADDTTLHVTSRRPPRQSTRRTSSHAKA